MLVADDEPTEMGNGKGRERFHDPVGDTYELGILIAKEARMGLRWAWCKWHGGKCTTGSRWERRADVPNLCWRPDCRRDNRFPLHFVGFQLGMRNQKMPDDGLKRLRVRRDRFRVDHRD